MIDSIDRIQRFTNGLTMERFEAHEMAQFAVIKCFEIIGEAAYHLSPSLKNQFSEVEWRKIQSFRHVLVHQYYQINLAMVWNTLETKLPGLRKALLEIRKALAG